ncbi:MAG TPA: NnrS family protein [Methylomirabilota bacterium]|nr:NnrS family protein [Methylomirabilota bacterium]
MSNAVGGIPRYRAIGGPALFQAGFRPFFLAAALWPTAGIGLWYLVFTGRVELATGFDPVAWHMHEMLFGYATAAVAGFMLTAIPNWTGRLPLQGAPLVVLVLLWAGGRAAMLVSATIGPVAAALIDGAFLAALLLAVVREIAAGRNWRNLPMVGALALLLIANACMHLKAIGLADTARLGMRLGLAVLLMLIALVGGRIIPSFTRNWLVKRGQQPSSPASFGTLDRLALATTGLGLAGWVAALPPILTGGLLIAAGLLAGVRLARWRGHLTLAEPLLLVLHVGHGWLAAGLMLLGASQLWPAIPPSAALHALTVGAVGTMTLAVMTRATLGHTGRPLTARPGTFAIYALVTLAALARIGAAVVDTAYLPLLGVASACWIAAFGGFLVLYGPILLAPCEKGQG